MATRKTKAPSAPKSIEPKVTEALARKVLVDEAPSTEVVIAYKGFDKDLCCAPSGVKFRYEVGKTYTHDGPVIVCDRGFHACSHPLAVWGYYGVNNGNRFALVEQSGELSTKGDKTASQKITIKAEIGIPGLIKAAVEWTKNKAVESTSGDYANSATSGYGAHSATSGNSANSATSGYGAKSSAMGDKAVAANAGNGAAKAGNGGAIFIVERDNTRKILAVFASRVGENGIKPDTRYALKGGKPVEVAP